MAATITKASTVTLNNVTLTASATSLSGGVVGLTDVDSATVNLRITNGATGPTVPAQFQIYTTPDDGVNLFAYGGPLVSQVGNNIVTEWGDIFIPPGTRGILVSGGSNTGQNVTARATVNTYKKL